VELRVELRAFAPQVFDLSRELAELLLGAGDLALMTALETPPDAS
jgi:hypothetical protein